MNLNDPNGVRIGGFVHPAMVRKAEVEFFLGQEYNQQKEALQSQVNMYHVDSDKLQMLAEKAMQQRYVALIQDPVKNHYVLQMYDYLMNYDGSLSREAHIDMLIVGTCSQDKRDSIENFLCRKYGYFLSTVRQASMYAYQL